MIIKNLQDLIDNNIVKFYVKNGNWTGILRKNDGTYSVDCYDSGKYVRTVNTSLQDCLDWNIEVIETTSKMLVVNLFGTPGAGKSTGAAYIFSELKMRGINAELVTEFAKDKVWENNDEVFKNQAYIFGKQSYKMSRCRDKVEVIITDSPLPLSIFYNHDEVLGEDFNRTVMNVFNSYNNINFLLLRTKPYNPNGRMQTEAESDALKVPMVNLLNERKIPYTEVNGSIEGYEKIINDVVSELVK